MGCIDFPITDAPGGGFCGGHKLSEIGENPNFLHAHWLAFKNLPPSKPCCSLATQADTLESPISDFSTCGYAEDVVHPHFRHGRLSSVLGIPGDICVKPVQDETHARHTHVELSEFASIELSSLEIMETQMNDLSISQNVARKTSITGKPSHLEMQSLQTSIDDDLSYLETTALLSSMNDLLCVLKKCRQKKELACARRAHFHACRYGLEAHPVLGNFLVPMFVECGCLSEGQQVFDKLAAQNEHSWTSLIQGSIEWGESQQAFSLFKRMEHYSVQPSSFTFVALLKACAIERCMEIGRELHAEITKQGHETETFVGNVLLDMYSKCGSLGEAQRVFDRLPVPDVVSWNTLIAGFVEHGHSERALSCLEEMQFNGLPLNDLTFIFGLKASGSIGALGKGQCIHAELARDGYECAFNLGSTLVDMYAKCGSLMEARDVFDNLRDRDAVSWNPLIVGYAEHGLGEKALECLEDMKLEGFHPDAVALAGCIKACGSLGSIRKGHEIHAECTKQGMETHSFIGSTLVDMYGKCGSVVEAHDVFNKLPFRGVVPWTALIAGYADCGLGEEALSCLRQMQVEGVPANDVTLVCCLKACGAIEAVEMGRELHMKIAKEGLEMDPFIGSALVDMYAKCSALSEAHESLTRLPVRGVVVWTALIAGYAEEGLSEEALHSLKQMEDEYVIPNAVTYVCSLKACGNLASLHRGQELHADIAIEGFELEPLVGTSLVDMYIKCGSLAEACEVFDKLSARDVAAWNAMIAGYTEHEFCEEALGHFRKMQFEGMSPNAVTFVLALKACGTLQAVKRGQQIFMQIVKEGLDEDSFIGNTLIDFYAKCGHLIDAQEELEKLPIRDVVSWTSLIAGYAEYGFCKEALECTSRMKSEGLLPDAGTFVCCLKACGNLGAIDRGQEIHMEIAIEGLESDFLVGNTLVDMYAKCGWLTEAQEVFDSLQVQDVVSWTALIGGFAEYKDESEALNCFQQMQLKGVSPDVVTWNNLILGYADRGETAKAFEFYRQMQEQGLLPNRVTFTNSLKACGSTATLKVGKKIVAHIYGEAGLERVEIVMENAVVDMYGRCGSMAEAQQAFDAMPRRQLVTWNGLITGYARQGESDAVFLLMSRMREEGIQPNEITLLCVLAACNHAGLVDRGKEYFKAMKTEYQLDRNIMHHNCMIDLLGRAGHFDEVLTWLQEMPIEPNHVTWITVLSACQTWGNFELGRHAFESLLKLDGKNIAAFVMMANIYANANMWDEVKKIEFMRVNLGGHSDARKTWIEVGGVSHVTRLNGADFCKSRDQRVSSIGLKGECLPNLYNLSKDQANVPECETLCLHTRTFGIAQGLLSAYESAPVRIVKNAWICDDCHAVLAVLSESRKHSIFCRDTNRIHIFKDGKCSCMNYG